MKPVISAYLILFSLFVSCTKEEMPGDTQSPRIVSTQPLNNASKVASNLEVLVNYDEEILLDDNYQITVNGNPVTATASLKKLTINVDLQESTSYSVNVSAKSVKDLAGNYAPAVSFSFKTKYPAPTDGKYEAEYAVWSSGNSVLTEIAGYSGQGYVGGFHEDSDFLTFTLDNITKGKFDLYIGYSTANYGGKICDVDINGMKSSFELSSSNGFTEKKYSTVLLKTGTNTIKIIPNWTWFLIDYIKIVPNADPGSSFNIDPNLVTPNPSTQAVNLYNYLKTNFLTNIISGTMANYSTNIDEATWVHEQTGKWPALTCFDFIDHTNQGSGWVAYDAPFTLGSDWWANNGIVALMWHWRDPLNKSGAFYTENTTFDVSKINDSNSPEYAAMLEDIDLIAGYLKQFRDANIPVIWRPMHEAAGGWFWWGAKGAAPCKALWQLMYDRMVNYHGLNNLIWVWTTNTNSDATDWYPGDAYVDIIGMDIYPGENQHGSQYVEFNRVKDIFGGKKIITLSECGSAPDPKQMMEYGDTWSWFMPWNGDFTRSDQHNGKNWWIKFFSNSYVITRDKMPDLH